jgi:2-polyprenyl-6-methoxyphenol hydroxylase-like FAD-dependent oxidoreductase
LTERIAVVGAGIAGLSCALALAGRGFEVTLFERDAAPSGASESASDVTERRRGVPHAVHPHFFMGRLREALRARHPELLSRLAAAGAGEGRFEESLHPFACARYTPHASDRALTSIAARRTTFERAMRETVLERGYARIESGVQVAGLLVSPGSPPRVHGLRLAAGAAEVQADVVIDASGRGNALARELTPFGVRFDEERHDAGIAYFTRHYQLQPGRAYPLAHGLPGLIFPDFIVGALPADGGDFTVTYQVYRDDAEMAAAVREPESFHALGMRLPVIARWIDPSQARPASGVFGFAQMDAFWRKAVSAGEPGVLGLHFVGDAAVRSNPKYGRGCTWSLVAAELLADALTASASPRERALRYDAALERELRADWRTMLAMDAASRARFEVASGRRRASLAERAQERFAQLVDEAQAADGDFFRGIWTGYHGLAQMDAWMRSPAAWLRLARHAVSRSRRGAVLAERSVRPARAEIVAASRARTAIAT